MIQFEAQPIIIAEAGEDSPRTISGVAVPWNVAATVSDGQTVKFLRGAFNTAAKPAKLLEGHDMTQLRGVVTALADEEDGLHFTARFAKTRAADEAIELVKASAYDAVSVGAVPRKFKFDRDGTMVVSSADLLEISLVAVPAFSAAQITEIAASADPEDDETQPQDTPQEDQVSEEIKAEAPEAPATIPTPLFAEARRPFKLPSAAEYIAAMTRGGSEFAQLNANIRAAAGDDTTGDTPGLLPTPVLGPIYDDINPLRPIVSALGTRSMPGAGKVFIRPKISTHTEVGNQATELTGLSTRTMEIDDVQVTKKTFGGTVLLSEQVIDWSDPSMLDAVLRDLAGQYALSTELEAINTMLAATTVGTMETVDLTDSAAVIAGIYSAAAEIAATGNYLPTHVIVSPSAWAALGSLTDDSDRPVFPQTAPLNGIGTLPGGAAAYNGNPLGLQLVVSNQITDQAVGTKDADEFLWIVNARFMECYEQQKGAVSVEVPSTLGRQLSFRGYFASVVMDASLIKGLGPSVA
jgi:HK97 family phage prohead protease